MRFNASNILNKLHTAEKAVDASMSKLTDKATNLVTKWFEVGNLSKALREQILHNLAQIIVANYEKAGFEWEQEDPEGRVFTKFVVPFFENFPQAAESKAWKKLDDAQKRSFAKSWSEVIVVPMRTGKTATQKRTANRQQAKSKPLTLDQVSSAIESFSAKEKLALLKALNKSLGLSIPADMLKVG